jgi:release factor glutamine methyltransferase
MALEVEEGVLIPRPETEELVEWIVSESLPESTILDVCTGSGCIALALARYMDKSSVTGIDLSPSALAIARRNGAKYAPDVVFLEADALADFASIMTESKFDIIVSNPPYIPLGDKARMRPNVTEYEPDMALYVPDDDALLFYRSIARNAHRMLNEGGKLYFEIYEEYAEQMCDMLRNEGYTRLRLREDFRAKQRMICAEI